MCGRFQLNLNDSEFQSIFRFSDKSIFGPAELSGEFVPSLFVPALCLSHKGEIAPHILKWGLVNPAGKGLLINARAETVSEKPFFRYDFENRRCLIPAHGFFEWDDSGRKFLFKKSDDSLFFLGGIFRRLTDSDNCLILTRPSSAPVSAIHCREPVMLEKENARAWLSDSFAARALVESDFSDKLTGRAYD